MFRLHSVLLIALDVVRGPYLHCFAPVNPLEREDVGGFSDIFVPRPEFCRRVMSLLEAESGLFFLFYPEEIAGLHYTRKTLRYTLCFVFCVDPSLMTIGAGDARRHVEPYIIVLTSIAEELRDAELRFGVMSRGLTVPGDAAAASPPCTIRANAFLSPAKDTAALPFSSLDSFVASLFSCLSGADHRGEMVSVRLNTALAFSVRRAPLPPLRAMADVPVPIATCPAAALEWADIAVRDVFAAADGRRTVAEIARRLAAGRGAAETVREALRHLEAQHYVRVVKPCGMRSVYGGTRALEGVLCDPSHAARRVIGAYMLEVEKGAVEARRQRKGTQCSATSSRDSLGESSGEYSRQSSGKSLSSRSSSGGRALRAQSEDATAHSEEEVEAAAAAALCALGKFTNNTIPNVRQEMRWVPVWCNAFAKWDKVCCKALVEVALLNEWLVEVTSDAHEKVSKYRKGKERKHTP